MTLRRHAVATAVVTVGLMVAGGCADDDEGDVSVGDQSRCATTSSAVAASPGGPGGSGLPGQNVDEAVGGAEADTIPPDADTGIGSTDDGANATTTTCP